MGKLLAARRFLHGAVPLGDELCSVCGSMVAESQPAASVAGANFTAWQSLMLAGGERCCGGCGALLKDPRMRSKIIVAREPGTRAEGTAAEILEVLRSPPEAVVLSIPQSHKKHHWLHAGLSDETEIIIGTDDRSVRYAPTEHAHVLGLIEEMLARGVPITQLISGRYHPATYDSYGAQALARSEEVLRPHRVGGLVQLLARLIPKELRATRKGWDPEMISEEDRLAAEYLAAIATDSDYRVEHGIDFWAGFFLHRLERVARCDLATATDRLIGMLVVSPNKAATRVLRLLAGYDEAQTATVEKVIRDRPKLAIALAYTLMKDAKDGGQTKLW